MDMNLVDPDEDEASNNEDTVNSVPLGYLGIKLQDPLPAPYEPELWRKIFPIWQEKALTARHSLGDCHVMTRDWHG